MRASGSVPPPGGKGTTRRNGFSGYSACTAAAIANADANKNTDEPKVTFIFILVSNRHLRTLQYGAQAKPSAGMTPRVRCCYASILSRGHHHASARTQTRR